MEKKVPLIQERDEVTQLKKALSQKHLSYVLITCTEPTHEGEMNVEMACEGDPDLLSMMVDGAKDHLV